VLILSDVLISELIAVFLSKGDGFSRLKDIFAKVKAFELRTVCTSLLRFLNLKLLSQRTSHTESSQIRNVAAFLKLITEGNAAFVDLVVGAATHPERTGLYCSLDLLRSICSSVSYDEERACNILDSSMEKFTDEIFTKHAPIVQQENNAQLLLLSSGHVSRKSPLILRGHARSSQYLNAVSKHLASNSSRVRWLGMLVGTAVSTLVDKAETRMTFGDDFLTTPESKDYLRLISIDDKPAEKVDLELIISSKEGGTSTDLVTLPVRKKGVSSSGPKSLKSKPRTQKIIKIVELDEEGEDDDLVAYPKPDSDPEDEDEDPTLINRDKPKPPVYIRDLLVGLRETENYDRHRIALETAASLIRRKSGFGKEVSDHSLELATVLMNLNDQFEMDDFLELRHQALVAIILADPTMIAEYMAANLFETDFSIQQRTSILTALGLSARELAGYKDGDNEEAPSFPTKQLPNHLHNVYSDAPLKLLNISSRLQQSITEPLALEAADKLTGPNVLKVRTFSSRMQVEKKKEKRRVANALTNIVADKFFFPLTGRWWIAKASNPHGPFLSGYLLPTYLRTLAIILHASGPFTITLPQMTSELWDLLLAVRSSSLSNKEYGVLEALLFTFLVLLEVNEHKERLARENARDLVETQEWARMVLEVIQPGDEEGEKVRALAASVAIRCQEVVEKWQRLMVGDLIDA
jgi:telomere length regulation protein